MNKLQGYIVATILIFMLGLVSCEPEPIEPVEPTCSCQDVHELLEPVPNGSGGYTMAWVIGYETVPVEMDCSNATVYTYSPNGTQRWITNCY